MDDNDNVKTETRVRFNIVDFDFDPASITETLGVQPTKTWKIGEPRYAPEISAQRAGSPLAYWKNNGWVLKSSLAEDRTVDDHVEALIKILAPCWGQLKELAPKCYFELAVTMRMFNVDRPPLWFDASLIKKLAELNAHVDVDLYNF
ncbi:MAG TPA: DUF4279 domain-containing protein [Elusimicrobiota bacterium]|nr:DUF4279 domain-containing protein [Elusimicrobiota bacterium]